MAGENNGNKTVTIVIVALIVGIVVGVLLTAWFFNTKPESKLDSGYVAEKCLKGNLIACDYHTAIETREGLETALDYAKAEEELLKELYLESVNQPTPTPTP